MRERVWFVPGARPASMLCRERRRRTTWAGAWAGQVRRGKQDRKPLAVMSPGSSIDPPQAGHQSAELLLRRWPCRRVWVSRSVTNGRNRAYARAAIRGGKEVILENSWVRRRCIRGIGVATERTVGGYPVACSFRYRWRHDEAGRVFVDRWPDIDEKMLAADPPSPLIPVRRARYRVGGRLR